jgi:hypothetical protein
MRKTLLVFALALTTVSAGSVFAAPATHREPLDAATLNTVRSRFSTLMELANRHDLKALHEMFWQSPSALLVAKSATRLRATGLVSGATMQSMRSCTISQHLGRSCFSQTFRSSRLSA